MTITSQSSPRADRLLIRNLELAAKNPGGRDKIEIYIDRTMNVLLFAVRLNCLHRVIINGAFTISRRVPASQGT